MDMPEADEDQQQQQQQDFVEEVADSNVLPDPVEEDALTKFNAEWNAKLEAKLEAERAHDKKCEEEALADIENFNSQRGVRLNAKKEANRSEEQVFLEQQESEFEGDTWDRVTKLIECSSEDADLEKSDVSRMRKLFIQLKNEPLEASRAAPINN